jgi:NAD(P)-dependent dehydrogenase (short-subunit alcohol dehydrogenase family)
MQWDQKHVLVTGGASFIGSHLVDALVERGAKVRVVDNLSSGREQKVKHHLGSGARAVMAMTAWIPSSSGAMANKSATGPNSQWCDALPQPIQRVWAKFAQVFSVSVIILGSRGKRPTRLRHSVCATSHGGSTES